MIQNEEKKQYKFFQTPKVLKKLDPYEWVLFTVLFDEWQMMKNEEGWFFRSEDDLSEDTGLSSATIYRKTKSLEEKGFILVKRHSDGKTKSKKYKSNDYKINIKLVISLAQIESHHREIESHHREIESHQKDEPTNNIPTNNIPTNKQYYSTMENAMKTFENRTPDDVTSDMFNELINIINNKIKNISSEVTPGTGIFQDEKVNNDLKLNDMKKENEMSDNGTNAMNAISEQSERQARENESSESGTKNEMTTSTPGNKNNTSREIQNIPVDKSKVINNDCNVQGVIPNAKDCAPAPASQTQTQNKATGEPQNVSVDNLSTQWDKTRHNARKEEIRRFNERHDKNRWDMCHNINSSADFDRVNAKLQEDIEYVNRCDWSEDRKKLWHSNYDLWRSKCGPIVMKHLNKVMEMENAS